MTEAPDASSIASFAQRMKIAYFSMEIAIRPEMRTYAGGLGVLAGDTARTCADLELPVVFVTLGSHAGYRHGGLLLQQLTHDASLRGRSVLALTSARA